MKTGSTNCAMVGAMLVLGMVVSSVQGTIYWRDTFDDALLTGWAKTGNVTTVDLGIVDAGKAGDMAIKIDGQNGFGGALNTAHTVGNGDLAYPGVGETRYFYMWNYFAFSANYNEVGMDSAGDYFDGWNVRAFGFLHVPSDGNLFGRYGSGTFLGPVGRGAGFTDFRIVFTNTDGTNMTVDYEYKAGGDPTWILLDSVAALTSDFSNRLVKLASRASYEEFFVGEVEYSDEDRDAPFIPEPASLALLAVGGLALLRRR